MVSPYNTDSFSDLVGKLVVNNGGTHSQSSSIFDNLVNLLKTQVGHNKWGSNDGIWDLWQKVLLNQGGTEAPAYGDTQPILIRKILFNQHGAHGPAYGDGEWDSLFKIVLNGNPV